jgi:hypothetical protein
MLEDKNIGTLFYLDQKNNVDSKNEVMFICFSLIDKKFTPFYSGRGRYLPEILIYLGKEKEENVNEYKYLRDFCIKKKLLQNIFLETYEVNVETHMFLDVKNNKKLHFWDGFFSRRDFKKLYFKYE